MVNIKLDKEKCIGCGSCIDSCPVSLYIMDDDKAMLNGDVSDCVLCRACESACPVAAIEVLE